MATMANLSIVLFHKWNRNVTLLGGRYLPPRAGQGRGIVFVTGTTPPLPLMFARVSSSVDFGIHSQDRSCTRIGSLTPSVAASVSFLVGGSDLEFSDDSAIYNYVVSVPMPRDRDLVSAI